MLGPEPHPALGLHCWAQHAEWLYAKHAQSMASCMNVPVNMFAPHCLMHTTGRGKPDTARYAGPVECMVCKQSMCDIRHCQGCWLCKVHTVSTFARGGPDLQWLLCRDPGFAARHSLDTISSVVRKANQVAPSSPAITSRVAAVLSRREREALARQEAAQSTTAPASHMSLRDAADLLDLESVPSGGRDSLFAGPAAEGSDVLVHLEGLPSGEGFLKEVCCITAVFHTGSCVECN